MIGEVAQLSETGGTPAALSATIEGLGVLLTLMKLIRTDSEMVGWLRREGRLSPDGMLVSPSSPTAAVP